MELTKKFREYISLYANGNLEEASKCYEEIFKLEREADDEKERIISEVSRGPFHPLDREDIIRLVLSMDDIAANLKSASRKLLYSNPSEAPDEVKKGLIELTKLLEEIVSRLGETLDALISGSKETLKLADLVERKEEEIDEFRHELIAKILEWGDSAKRLSRVLIVKEAVENIEAASDKAEDVADVIRSIVAVGPL
ncbi:MAG: hypothetical protein DRN64_05185 [Thaumarchaeota archaeon]|nr:MAG: hypothetical protein DRN64_05185 [Nitrososphaerota archaeon]